MAVVDSSLAQCGHEILRSRRFIQRSFALPVTAFPPPSRPLPSLPVTTLHHPSLPRHLPSPPRFRVSPSCIHTYAKGGFLAWLGCLSSWPHCTSFLALRVAFSFLVDRLNAPTDWWWSSCAWRHLSAPRLGLTLCHSSTLHMWWRKKREERETKKERKKEGSAKHCSGVPCIWELTIITRRDEVGWSTLRSERSKFVFWVSGYWVVCLFVCRLWFG